LQSPLFAWDNVDLGPKLDVAPISREEAGQACPNSTPHNASVPTIANQRLVQALTVAMTMPGAYTELSALLHCTNGPDALAKKAAFVAKTMDHSQMPVLKHAYLELLKDCIVAKAQHQNVRLPACRVRRTRPAYDWRRTCDAGVQMRKEIVRIISMGKASRVVRGQGQSAARWSSYTA
jgi:hypothetical protein